MNAPFTQDARLGKLTTALGKDALVLLRFDGADHINDLFEYHVEALSAKANIDFDGLIGTHASVEIDTKAMDFVPLMGLSHRPAGRVLAKTDTAMR